MSDPTVTGTANANSATLTQAPVKKALITKTDVKKYIVYGLCSAIMVGILFLVPILADTLSLFYIGIVGAFLGLDLVSMIKSTNLMPPGEYREMKEDRYLVTALVTVGLFVVCMIVKTDFVPLLTSITAFSSTLMIIATMYIGGLEANKIAVRTKPIE